MFQKRPIASFFIIAYAFSWIAWAPLALEKFGLVASASKYLHLVGGLGPLVAATCIATVNGGAGALRRSIARSLGTRHHALWLLVACLLPVALFVAARSIVVAMGHSVPALQDIGTSAEYPELPKPAYWAANIVFYGFGEEVGWRGFALPRVQAKRSALASALLIGLAWAGWHAPLFAFASGMSAMGIGAALGWLASILVGSMLMTWLINSSGGSVVAAAIFHGVLDIFMTSAKATDTTPVMGALLTVGALLIIPAFGWRNLARAPRVIFPDTGPDAAAGELPQRSLTQ